MDELEKILTQFKAEHLAVCVPEGNNGDKLIYLGLEKLLKCLEISFSKFDSSAVRFSTANRANSSTLLTRIAFVAKSSIEKLNSLTQISPVLLSGINNLNHKIAGPQKIPSNIAKVIIINGGGNINDFYAPGKNYAIKIIEQNPKSVIIIAPETFYFSPDSSFLNSLKKANQEIYLFCRERYSFSLMNSLNFHSNFHILLSSDTSFYLSEEDLIKISSTFAQVNNPYDLLSLRTDKESALSRLAIIKKLRNQRIIVKDISEYASFNQFLNFVQHSRHVFTDRLHVAILASVFGKETYLFPNAYYKNKAVFEYSLCNNPKVTFVNNPQEFVPPFN